ncbi:hypothetical protein BDZ45DRAFT_743248 [Acephala macrosclerotiorum]|nr:hypothetical protein BDZ45DRAFT_743248 [Acephala macrosclerotiorum]
MSANIMAANTCKEPQAPESPTGESMTEYITITIVILLPVVLCYITIAIMTLLIPGALYNIATSGLGLAPRVTTKLILYPQFVFADILDEHRKWIGMRKKMTKEVDETFKDHEEEKTEEDEIVGDGIGDEEFQRRIREEVGELEEDEDES